MFCAVSGSTPEHPVVSTKSGHIFESSVIEKYLETTGKCPVTGEPLEAADLLPLKTSTVVKPRPIAATSIPGMLTLFQNEWDALMLETHTLKQQLETVRQELGHALYQHDAACRVIARLIQERDDARNALAEARSVAPAAPQPAPTAAPSAPAAPPATATGAAAAAELPAEVVGAFEATAKVLFKGRKKRPVPDGYTTAETLSAFAPLGAPAAHATGHVCVDAHTRTGLVATGGADGTVTLSDCASAAAPSTRATISAHTKGVTMVRLHPTKEVVISASLDGTARIASTSGGEATTVMTHQGGVTGCTLHATGDYLVTCSSDSSWALSSLVGRPLHSSRTYPSHHHLGPLCLAASAATPFSIARLDPLSPPTLPTYPHPKTARE